MIGQSKPSQASDWYFGTDLHLTTLYTYRTTAGHYHQESYDQGLLVCESRHSICYPPFGSGELDVPAFFYVPVLNKVANGVAEHPAIGSEQRGALPKPD